MSDRVALILFNVGTAWTIAGLIDQSLGPPTPSVRIFAGGTVAVAGWICACLVKEK
ncbi:MAG: hypothetical protein UY96_C0003G0034 [Parcubacteria group bacterium GW2011_GWB1_56_8]|nr:MAG: hypothetical protein UY96_C0003G0034 [Parcubacteria group bacterium GW2011_GWB1_56_8]